MHYRIVRLSHFKSEIDNSKTQRFLDSLKLKTMTFLMLCSLFLLLVFVEGFTDFDNCVEEIVSSGESHANSKNICEKISKNNVQKTRNAFVTTFQGVILKQLGFKETPTTRVEISLKEQKYVQNITKELEKSENQDSNDYKIDVIYPKVKSTHKGRQMNFWLPDCTGYTCHINLAKLRVVLRVKTSNDFQNLQFKIAMVNESGATIFELSTKDIQTKRRTLMLNYDLDDDIKKINDFTGRKGIAIICDSCKPGMTTIALKAKRYKKQRSSLTILWKKTIDVRERSFPIFKQQLCNNCCQVHTKEVTVRQLGWDGWLLYPRKFVFSYCQGSCKNNNNFLTDYSQILHSLNDLPTNKRRTSACCVPSEYTSLKLIYYYGNTVRRRTLKTLLATSCGCV